MAWYRGYLRQLASRTSAMKMAEISGLRGSRDLLCSEGGPEGSLKKFWTSQARASALSQRPLSLSLSVHLHIYMRICMSLYLYVSKYLCVSLHTFHMRSTMYIHPYLYLYLQTYVCIHFFFGRLVSCERPTCKWIQWCIYIYIHIRTYIHTNIYT